MNKILPHLPRPLPIVIDTDPAGGIFLRDIDDVLAICFLLASAEVRVDGLTITYGNASLKNTFQVAKKIRDLTGVNEMPVLSGASSAKDRGKLTPAVEFIIEYFRHNQGGAALLTLGPLTNLAGAIRIEPRLVDWIPAVVMMGGNLGAKFPLAPFAGFEFNFYLDPVSANEVLTSRLNKWLAPTELCIQAQFGFKDLARLRSMNMRCVADRICRIEEWIRINSAVLGPGGFFPWDPIAAAMLVSPDLYEDSATMSLGMSVKGLRRKLIKSEKNDGTPCIVPTKLRSSEFMDLLIDRLSSI